MANNEDLTNCTVCFEEYDKDVNVPRLLSCSHTLCQCCLQDLIRTSKVDSFKCPECRITHEITERGVKEFPQNKYILSHLEKVQKDQTADGCCANHKRPLALYCSDTRCRKVLCAICYIEDHKDHPVKDFVQEAQRCKEMVSDKIDLMLKTIVKHKELLTTAGNALDEATENSFAEMNKRKKCLIDQINSEFQVLFLILETQRVKEFEQIKEKVSNLDKKGAHLANVLQELSASNNTNIIENYQAHLQICETTLKGLIPEETETREFHHRLYTPIPSQSSSVDEKIKELVGDLSSTTNPVSFPSVKDIPEEDAAKKPVQRTSPKYRPSDFDADCRTATNAPSVDQSAAIECVKEVRKFKTNCTIINALHVVNRQHTVLAGEDEHGVKWIIIIDKTGRMMWNRQLESELSGVVSISLACTPCLILAYNEGSKIDFHDMKKKDTILFSLDLKEHKPGCLDTNGDLFCYVDWSTTPHSLRFVDCSRFPPEIQDSEVVSLTDDLIADVCLVRISNSLKAIISTDKDLCAFDVNSGAPLWQVSGKLGTSKENLYPWGLCSDGKGNIFVADRSNDCIHLIGTDGTFTKTLIENLPYIQEITWDFENNQLIAQHEELTSSSESDETKCEITVFQICYKETNSALGKVVGSLFGNKLGGWVEGNIDTIKYGFSDIGSL